MTDKKPDGGLAFPTVLYDTNGKPTGQDLGLTMRDWFAGQAISGLLASRRSGTDVPVNGVSMSYTEASYAIADAMLAERVK